MREYAVPASYSVPEDWSCVQVAYDRALHTPDQVCFRRSVDGVWTDVTAREFAEQVRAVARGLVATGVEGGDRVAVLSSTRYEWVVFDFAIWAVGAITVPIYDSSSADQIRWVVQDSGARLMVVENAELRAVAEEGTEGADLIDILVIDGDRPAVSTLTAAGAEVAESVLDERRAAVTADSPATLIYTSGTTGRPKGCMLTHRNFLSEALSILETPFRRYLHDDSFSLMFLPLAHVLARAVNYAGIYAGVTLSYTSDLTRLVESFGELRPNYILSVPRVFEKVFNTAQAKAQDGGRLKAAIFKRAVAVAIDYSRANRVDGSVPLPLKLQHALFDKLVYGKLSGALGGRCEVAISGGAPLSERLAYFFDGVGVTIYEGYGLTESSAALCVNTPDALRIGTVGPPMPGNAVRIAADGEIEIRGPVVTGGYWQNAEATEAAFSDGWFRTGDLGSLDEDGFLTITGRKKEIIVTAGGKNVAPSQLEDGLRADPLIGEAVCVGDGKPFIGVLLTLDPDAFDRWKNYHGKSGSVGDLTDDPDLVAHLDHALARANRSVSHTEAIKKYRLLPVQFTEATGELTPSMKVKRNIVHDKFAREIESLYS